VITKETITAIAKEGIGETDKFLVEVQVSPGNKIHVEVDSPAGVNVIDCRELSRYIEGRLDREAEDFELTVSSPGLDKPFRVKQQYDKNVGRSVEVMLQNGEMISGKLITADENGIELETSAREKAEGKKSKQDVVRLHKIAFGDIKQTKVIISFK
jgi:ribosome maturation factor RimP